jgi:hypothetical protein
MVRPEDLLHSVQVHDVADRPAGMRAGERLVTGGMPILRRDHQRICRHQPIGHRDHRITIRNRQRPARQEVVLNINQQ